MHIHKCAVFLYRLFHSKLTDVAKQLACIWPYSFSPLGPLIWTPALFFFLLLFCCHTRRLFLDGENEAADLVAQPQTQLAVLRWVQLVGVRGSSIHTGQNWFKLRTTVEGGEGASLTSQDAAVRVHLSVVHNTTEFLQNLKLCFCDSGGTKVEDLLVMKSNSASK